MATRNWLWSGSVLGLSCCVLVSAGCGAKEVKHEPTEAEKNIQCFNFLYQQYTAKHQRRPANAAELKEYAKGLPAKELKALAIEEGGLDKVFVSPRDNQPYEIFKGMPVHGMMPISVYEKEGEGGVRLGVTAQGTVVQIDDEGMQKMLDAEKAKGGRRR
jgi:hypothetical protein